MHSAAIADAGLDLVYVAFDVPPERLVGAVRGLGALGALGANVTVPHKQSVLDLVDVVTDEARLVGAANTLHWTGDGLMADNTDAGGLSDVLRSDVGLSRGARAVLLGSGGAARAAAVALGRVGASVTVHARRPDAGAAVAALVDAAGGEGAYRGWLDAAASGPVRTELQRADLLIQATTVGLHGETLPDAYGPSGQVVLDLVYGDQPTPLLRRAAERGARALDGLGMLAAQAARSFRRWTGVDIDVEVFADAARTNR